MTMKREFRASVRLLEERGAVGRIVGTIIEEGRVASDRREVFTSGSVKFPHEGIKLLRDHGGDEVLTFIPKHVGAEIRINELLPDTELGRRVAAEVRSGARSSLSVEFTSLSEQTVSSVREVRSALVEAVALVEAGSYTQARAELRAEVRHKRRRRRWR